MACFLIPTTEAIVTTVITKVMESKEKKLGKVEGKVEVNAETKETSGHVPFTRKLKWLNTMLWGGSALLAFEHVWHGEVVPWFPFLTAAGNPEDAAEMLHEMSTVGVGMAIMITLAWGGIVLVTYAIEKRADKSGTAEVTD